MKNRLIHHSAAAAQPGGHVTKRRVAKQAVMLRASRVGVALLLVFVRSAVAAPLTQAPTAKEILSTARMQQARQDVDLQGQLRQNDKIVPFRLTQSGGVTRYSFINPDEALQLRLGTADSKLEEINKEGVDKISGPEFEQNVRGTPVTYEDLALKFLYWPNAKLVGDDSINTRRVWKLELQPPGRASQYSRVVVWTEQQSGALMRMEGYDWNGRLAKRFEVVSVQKIDGRYFLKQMRIEAIQPDTGKVQSRTYLEIKK